MHTLIPPDGASSEADRVRTLDQYDVLDAPPAEAFDRITRLATRIFDVPIAMANFIDHKDQWCVSARGLSIPQMPRELSFCTHTIEQEEVMVVEDAREDPRFADNPLVTGEPHIRFYAGAPLVARNGSRIGSLCIIDDAPRTFSDADRATLDDLAGVVMDELHLRSCAFDLDASRAEHRAENEQTTRILESITDAFFALDDDWTFTYVNAQAEALLERPRENLLGRNVWDEFAEAAESTFQAEYQHALEAQTTVEFIEYYPPLDRWFEVKAFPFQGGLSVYFDDVSDRVEAQENLRRERDLTEAIMDTSIAAIVTVDADGVITFANDRAGEILGTSPDALVGRDNFVVSAFTYTPDGDAVDPADWPFNRIMETGESISEKRLLVKGGPVDTERIISVNGAPLCTPDGGVRQVVFSMVDITEQIERQRELEAARDEAERASRLKSSFLANMSHDVRTPLSSIMSLTELLSLEAPASCQDRIRLIERSSQRLLDTIDSVLDLSKLESGSMTPSPRDTDVADELHGTVEIFQPQADEADVTLNAEIPDHPVSATLDATMLHRITDNLITNAIKFTEPGGTVTVRLHSTDDTVTVEVEDTGPGIDAAFLPDLFEAFARGPGPSSQPGSGLGLAITKRLTDLLGGTIDVESTEGVGSRFTVSIPR